MERFIGCHTEMLLPVMNTQIPCLKELMEFLFDLVGVAHTLRELHVERRGNGGVGADLLGTLMRCVRGHTDFDEMRLGLVEEAIQMTPFGGFVVGAFATARSCMLTHDGSNSFI